MDVSGKVIVITGGAGLIGKEFVKAVVNQGGVAIIGDINSIVGKETVEEISKDFSNSNVDFHELDITSKDSINNLISYVHLKYGKIDALVNNAYPRNSNYGRKFEDVTYEDFCENINLNIGGYFLTSQQFIKYFKQQGFGNIVNISSIYGVVAPRFEIYENTPMTMPVEYAAIKSAIIHLTKYMAKYFKGSKIRVNAISLGGILDKQPENFKTKYKSYTLNKGMLDSADINGTLIYLLSDRSTYVNGQNIIVDDGFTL
jgi:NAD(P)-dependent dehydrogenase (short-subunit alcohol dehydrogenase family)